MDQGGGDAPPATALDAFARYARGLQLDLKVLPGVLDEVLALVQRHEFEDDRLWFNASIAAVGAEGFRRSWAAHPGAIVQCPVDFLEPLALAAPRRARVVLQMLAGWGISRFSVAWAQDTTLSSVQALQDWGYDINLYAVPDHESFLHAVLLLPRSLTADFDSRTGTIMGGARVNDGGITATGHPSRQRLPEDAEPCATAPRFSGLSDAPADRAWEARLR